MPNYAKSMPYSSSPCFVPTFLIILFIPIQTYSQNDKSPFLTYCSGPNFTSPSLYEANLRRLLAVLITSTPSSPSFYSTSTGTNSSSPQIYGLAQCRPDSTSALCASCLNNSATIATANSLGGCGNRKSAALRYDHCVLRYSDQQFFGAVEERIIAQSVITARNASEDFNRVVDNLMKKSIINSAATSMLKFSVGISNSTDDALKIYGMAWCTMDLERSIDCLQCLAKAMNAMVPGKFRGRVATVSCEVKYDTHQFFSIVFFSRPGIAPSPMPPVTGGEGKRSNKTKFIGLAGATGAVALLLFFTIFTLLLRQRKRRSTVQKGCGVDEEKLMDVEIQAFDFGAIKNATNNFAHQNKLGQGGFGPVYKGVLVDGQEIAVKRLSTTSVQGLAEMKNEIYFIAKLQHKNLARLKGYCLEGDEKLLVYEFLPNTSLDKFISDSNKRMQLDWETRVKIIIGIGRGIRYLHEDSRLRIIHRDLKASNILLDSNMNPKISDFGLAKLFVNDETERNTSQIAGTFGYMAPEYVMHGLFSTKSDVFSYGVLVLEIVTGEKSTTEESEYTVDLLSNVWKHWIQGKALQVIDKSLADQYSSQEALRCIQIGLLCVQQEQAQRPNMTSVMTMLSTLSMKLPTPSPPAFFGVKGLFINSETSSRIKDLRLPDEPKAITDPGGSLEDCRVVYKQHQSL